MTKQYLIADGFWLVLAVAVCVESWSLGIGEFTSPGPGFLPFWAGVLLGLLSLISLVQTATEKAKEEPSVWAGVKILKLGLVILTLLLYVALLNTLGFFLCTFLLLLFLFRAVEPYRWHVVLLASILSLAAVYVFFVLLLDVRLPSGILVF
ncbi:MAG: tripartite tricarboxylate transporter TctB family protein [Desulfomonile tiedjei]|nr:tripartite tricarboxylate transporter TctB family protein [Desulfomonile tiedjei]